AVPPSVLPSLKPHWDAAHLLLCHWILQGVPQRDLPLTLGRGGPEDLAFLDNAGRQRSVMFQHSQNCPEVPDPGTVPSSVASFSEKNKGMWLELSWKGSSVKTGSLKKTSLFKPKGSAHPQDSLLQQRGDKGRADTCHTESSFVYTCSSVW
ncbi:hypothetical protein MC885_009606, partial [Smutsia gigantea]